MYLLFLLTLVQHPCLAHALTLLKGNLLFEEIGGHQLNQEYMTFSRKVDSSDLQNFAQTLKASAELYESFCQQVEGLSSSLQHNKASNKTFFKTPVRAKFKDSVGLCKRFRANLPEVRSIQEFRQLEDTLKQQGVKEVIAGIDFTRIGNTFKFKTDEANAITQKLFPVIYYGGSYENHWHKGEWDKDWYVNHQLELYPLSYVISQEGLRLRVIDKSKLETETYVICEVINTQTGEMIENNVLNKMASHNCKRDLPSIKATTISSLNEVKTITDLTIPYNDTSTNQIMENFLPTLYRSRKKRDLFSAGALSIFGTALGGSTYLLKSIIDTVMGNTQYAKKTDLLKVAHELDAVKINYQELRQVNEKISKTLSYVGQQIEQIYIGASNLNMETEIKNLNRYLQFVLTTTLLKYSQALMAAKDNKLHPYALSSAELKALTTATFNNYRIHLDVNSNNIQAVAIVHNNTITFLFDIPIIQMDKHFNFYSITPIPTFSNDATYISDMDANNIAISKNGDKYTTLTDMELSRCMDTPPICNSHRPVSPISSQALCVASTYVTNSPKCNLKQTASKPEPFLHFHGTKLFYSVPNNTTIYIKCSNPDNLGTYTEQTITIYGIGQANYKPSCTINLPDGTTFKTPSDKSIHTVNEWPIFDITQALPKQIATVITQPNFTIKPIFVAEQTMIQPIEQTFEGFTTKDLFMGMFSTITPILFMLSIIAIYCLCIKMAKKKAQSHQQQQDIQQSIDDNDYWGFNSLLRRDSLI